MTIPFAPSPEPRLFALPPGVDFTAQFAEGLRARMAEAPPALWARTEIYLNTERARRRLAEALEAGPVQLQPRLCTLGEIGQEAGPYPPLKRRLELARPIRKLISADKTVAARTRAFDLADTLAKLAEEMQAEGVAFSAFEAVDAAPHARHWQRSLAFLTLLRDVLEAPDAVDGEALRRRGILALAAAWAKAPPAHPVLVAGSTGSRGATHLFVEAVARLPQGAAVLPGLDGDLPARIWERLENETDHPQWALARLCRHLGRRPDQVPLWRAVSPPEPARAQLLSLALRPAPVTTDWRVEGPKLPVEAAARGLTLLEAPSARAEAAAIAHLFRETLERGKRMALITPDRALARRVAVELDRWGLAPDDSAGRPLQLTPPGVFLRNSLGLTGFPTPPPLLASLLKHPLTASAEGQRGAHITKARAFELEILRGPKPLNAARLAAWAEARGGDWPDWAAWLAELLAYPLLPEAEPLPARLQAHLALAARLAAGPGAAAGESGGLWLAEAGIKARAVLERFAEAAPASDPLDLAEYRTLFSTILAGEDVPDAPYAPHPDIAIWGTLEARTQTADLIVLGGLNEGTWPRLPSPDPWLNREIRATIGLLPAERQIGLSAHDFQVAANAAEVVISRSLRDAEAPTVASRWVLRLENLLAGLSEPGMAALAAIRAKGAAQVARAQAAERIPAAAPALRPAPIPPLDARPSRLSATRFEKLIRDPYAIYASHILRLRPLDPLGRAPDARERGQAFHATLEAFVGATRAGLPPDPRPLWEETLRETLLEAAPWPAIRAIWEARLRALTDWFLEGEVERRARATPALLEARGGAEIPGTPAPFRLEAIADRIDHAPDGLAIYDYKSALQSPKQMRHFDQQLQIEAIIAAFGGFEGLSPMEAKHLEAIGLKADKKTHILPGKAADTLEALIARTHAEIIALITHYQTEGSAYPARLRPETLSFAGDYDHLSRLGEWQDGDAQAEFQVP